MSSMKHKIVVQWMPNDNYDDVVQLLKDFNQYGIKDDLILANSSGKALDQLDVSNMVHEAYEVPSECDNSSKVKNNILSYMATRRNEFKFLHLIEGNTKLLKDPATYMADLENVMDVLDYSIHFSTTTDQCNYLFKKMCPRLTIAIDDEDIKKRLNLPASISFTSHSNNVWTTYDYEKCGGECPQLYDERFSIAMFMIIEYLARRRATRKPGQLYYMNQYLSIPSEVGVFTTVDGKTEISPEKMQEEDKIFKSLGIDYSPDNNIDQVLEDFYAVLRR